ncbi:MAG: hypothetical protein VX672_06150, partial [Planctomycetota bacterium]|nr:hypothetical protein [Planctomycetota bacterium]
MTRRLMPLPRFRVPSSIRRGGGAFLLAAGLLPGGALGQSEDFELPGPETIERLAPLVGDWSMTGVTAEGQEGIVGGLPFTAQQRVEWIDDRSALSVVWSVALEDGTTLAEGRGRIGWDEIAEAVVNTYRGEDSGRRFTGSATLIAAEADDALFDWRGHETAGTSSSVNFEVTYIFPDADTCLVDFIPTCIDG